MDLNSLSLGELLAVHGGVGRELIRRRISQTGNNPCGDFAEALVCRAFGWERQPNSKAGFDALIPKGTKIEIKARRVTARNPSRQASGIRGLQKRLFDRLVGVVFSESYEVILAVDMPIDAVVRLTRHSEHTNSAKLFLRDSLLGDPDITDITERLRPVAMAMLSEPSL